MYKEQIRLLLEQYYESESKNLESQLEKIKIDSEEEIHVIADTSRDKAMDLFFEMIPYGGIIKTLLNWNKECKEKLDDWKKQYLLNLYFKKVDHLETGMENLKRFLIDPQGQILFNKILRILEDNPPDLKLLNILANSIKHIVRNEDFSRPFTKHEIILSYIEQLSHQALFILADYKNWPSKFSTEGASATIDGNLITSWIPKFTEEYIKNKDITDPDITFYIENTLDEMTKSGIIVAKHHTDNNSKILYSYCEITKKGNLILPYITD